MAVLDGATGAIKKLIDLEKPGFIRAVSDELVYVVRIGATWSRSTRASGAVKDGPRGSGRGGRRDADEQGQLYVSVQGKVQQVKVFTADGKPAGEIGRKGGRPALGAWVQDGMLNPAGLVVDKEGKLWVAEATRRRSASACGRPPGADKKEGTFLKDFFGPTHYGASGGAINPRDPNVMAGEGCEWRIDPKTGRDVCLGSFAPETTRKTLIRWRRALCRRRQRQAVPGDDQRPLVAKRLRLYPGAAGRRAVRPARGRIVTNPKEKKTVFWADANGDEQQQPDELATYPAALTHDRLPGLVAQHEQRPDPLRHPEAKAGMQFKVADSRNAAHRSTTSPAPARSSPAIRRRCPRRTTASWSR